MAKKGSGRNEILTINPGSMSTKISVFLDEKMLFSANVVHKEKELSRCKTIYDQFGPRLDAIERTLKRNGYDKSRLTAVVGRGGPLKPLVSGTYKVNKKLVDDLRFRPRAHHVSVLGCIIADAISKEHKIPAFTVDPISVDEMVDEARISGHPLMPRYSMSHALNIKATARKAAKKIGKKYNQLNMVVAHLGSGFSITAHQKGEMIDVNNANEAGPFSPERCGTLPAGDLAKMCFSGEFTKKDFKEKLVRKGGMKAYLGTNDVEKVQFRIKKGDKKAELIYDAMIYQVAKEIGAMATTLNGKVDAIVITGAIAHSKEFIKRLKRRTAFIAKMMVFPGGSEEEALALGALRVLRGVESVKNYR